MAAPKINRLLTPYNFTDRNDTGRIRYIVIHYVGALGGAEANCRYYAEKYIGASAHYFVGFQGEIWQSVEDGDIAWHCGARSYKHAQCRNSNSIGIELCVRNRGSMSADSRDWYFEDATVESAAVLVRYLMEKYGIKADHVIRHYDATGKICPNPYVFNSTKHTWADFRKAVAGGGTGLMDSSAGKTGDGTAPGRKAEDAQSFDKGIAGTYIVNTSSDPLMLRSGASTGKSIIARMPKGAKVRCYGYYTQVNGVKWYYVVYNGKTGFASCKYLKKK